jgi:hypothetical protein
LASANKKKTVSKKKKLQNNSSVKTILPQPKLTESYPISSKKPETKKQRPFHAVGVMQTQQESSSYNTGAYQRFTPEQIREHIPQYNVVPYSKGKKPGPLSAAQINSKRDKNILPRFFMNPYQDLDYMVLQDIYANSIGGRIIDRKEELKFGNGIRPVLKLRNPKLHGDDEAQQKLLEDNQEIIDKILMIDDALGDPDDALDPFLDTDVTTKFQALSKNAAVFGRCMIVKQFTKRLLLDDGTLAPPTIPNILKVIHPRDMGIVKIDQESWNLKSGNLVLTKSFYDHTLDIDATNFDVLSVLLSIYLQQDKQDKVSESMSKLIQFQEQVIPSLIQESG